MHKDMQVVYMSVLKHKHNCKERVSVIIPFSQSPTDLNSF